jgi:hypothetical protein
MRILLLSGAALVVAGCVGDRAELGGVDNRLPPPALTQACNLDDVRIVERGTLQFPEDAMTFVYVSQQSFSLAQAKIRYDITEAGLPANISYAGPAADMRHATKQKVIRAAVDAVKQTRYEWIDQPGYGVGCIFDLNVEITNKRYPG